MRIMLTIVTFFSFVVVCSILLAFAPYHFYYTTITDGISTSFLHLAKTPASFLEPRPYEAPQRINQAWENIEYWRTLHFGTMEVPLPVKHPLISYYPLIKYPGGDTALGLSYKDVKDREIFAFEIIKSREFEIDMTGQALFELPLYKTMILRNTNQDLWKSTYSTRLSLPGKENKGFFEYLKYLWPVSYNSLVYNLFVLHVRHDFFKKYYDSQNLEIKAIEYLHQKNLAIIEFTHNDNHKVNEWANERAKERAKDRYEEQLFNYYHLYQLHNDNTYAIEIKVRKDNDRALWIKDHFVHHIAYKKSTEDSSAPLYAEYKSLPYRSKIELFGLSILLASWSHMPDNCTFLQEVVTFFERGGHKNINFILPIYEHAFKLCGSNYSMNPHLLKETVAHKHKRRVEEEKIKEREEIISRDISSQAPDEFESHEVQIDYLLKKAKEESDNDPLFDGGKSLIGL